MGPGDWDRHGLAGQGRGPLLQGQWDLVMELPAVMRQRRLSHSGLMSQDGVGRGIFVVGSVRCRQSWKEQASVLRTALVAQCGTPPLAGGALVVVGIVLEPPLGRAAVR